MFIIIFFLIIIGIGIGFLIQQAGLSIDIEKLEQTLKQFNLVILIILMAIMYFISYLISYKIYKNKEE